MPKNDTPNRVSFFLETFFITTHFGCEPRYFCFVTKKNEIMEALIYSVEILKEEHRKEMIEIEWFKESQQFEEFASSMKCLNKIKVVAEKLLKDCKKIKDGSKQPDELLKCYVDLLNYFDFNFEKRKLELEIELKDLSQELLFIREYSESLWDNRSIRSDRVRAQIESIERELKSMQEEMKILQKRLSE